VVLIGASPSDLAVGVLASAAASWTSLTLLPPGPARVRMTALLSLIPRFLWKSVVAGWDVTRRALDPDLPLRTGFVAYPARFRSRLVRNAFASYTSLLPGTLPIEVTVRRCSTTASISNSRSPRSLLPRRRRLRRPSAEITPIPLIEVVADERRLPSRCRRLFAHNRRPGIGAHGARPPDADYDPATGYSPGRSQVVERRHHLGL
jgi:multicomponent Na+:H+ antiporter subunit E